MDIGKIAAGLLKELDVECIRVEGMRAGVQMLLDAIREEHNKLQLGEKVTEDEQLGQDSQPPGDAKKEPGSST